MNLPKDFPEIPADFPELETLQEKMGAHTKPTIDIQLQNEGIPVLRDEYDVIDNEIPIIQKRKAVFYISNAWTYQKNAEIYGWKNKEPKYHVINCEKLQEMKENRRFNQYRATRRSDGNFLVKNSISDVLSPLELTLCRFCLNRLKEQYGEGVFPEDPQEFPLEDWFETFDYDRELNRTEPSNTLHYYSSQAWQTRSLACRENANWRCKQCKIDLKDERYFLHAHHKWGTKFDDPEDLMALCIRCHAEQPGDGHQLLKYYPEYQKFIQKYGNISQSGIRYNLPNQLPQRTQGESTLTYRATEDDIPF